MKDEIRQELEQEREEKRKAQERKRMEKEKNQEKERGGGLIWQECLPAVLNAKLTNGFRKIF